MIEKQGGRLLHGYLANMFERLSRGAWTTGNARQPSNSESSAALEEECVKPCSGQSVWTNLFSEAPWVLLLLMAYVVPLLIVPPIAAFPLIDDWNHALSVRHLVENGQLWIADWTATTLLFQVAWGALFTSIFGFSFNVLRLSTLVLSFAASLALYALCREVGVSPPRALLGALTLWLNPIFFGLSYTFMSDVPYVGLYLLATLCYARGVGQNSERALFVGSWFAAFAFLTRHQGALLPPAVILYGVLARWPLRVLVRRFFLVAGIPMLAVGGYLLWWRSRGIPQTQGEYITTLLQDGPRLGGPALILSAFIVIYLGLFWLPLALGATASILHAIRQAVLLRRSGWYWPVLWGGIVTALVLFIALRGTKSPYPLNGQIVHPAGGWMPYLIDGSMIHVGGLGPDDLLGERRAFLSLPARICFTILAAGGLYLLGVALKLCAGARRLHAVRPPQQGVIVALGFIGLFQFAGIFLPSVRLLGGEWLSFDRYLLPLAPLAIIAGLWATRRLRLSLVPMVIGLLLFAAFSLGGTQDWLSYNRLRWDLGRELLASGVPMVQIDGGMEWVGWNLYEYSQEQKMLPRTPAGPYWTYLIAPAVDSTYVIAFSPLPRYDVLERREYPSWLHREPVYLYVLRRQPSDQSPLIP